MGYVALRAKRFCFIFLISDNDELYLGGTGSIGDLEWHNVLGDNPLFGWSPSKEVLGLREDSRTLLWDIWHLINRL